MADGQLRGWVRQQILLLKAQLATLTPVINNLSFTQNVVAFNTSAFLLGGTQTFNVTWPNPFPATGYSYSVVGCSPTLVIGSNATTAVSNITATGMTVQVTSTAVISSASTLFVTAWLFT